MMAEGVDTPTAILANAAAALRENPFDEISYRTLGDAVGVSERTVYRHFPTRSHLLEGVAGWIESAEFPLPPFVTIPQFREASRDRFLAFDSSPAFAFVCARAASISPTGESEATFFTRALVAMLRDELPLGERTRSAPGGGHAALLRVGAVLGSHADGLRHERAGDLGCLRSHRRPGLERPSHPVTDIEMNRSFSRPQA